MTGFWIADAWICALLVIHAVFGLCRRRKLLMRLRHAVTVRDTLLSRTERSSNQIRTHLIAELTSTVGPALDEIRDALTAASTRMDPKDLRKLGDTLGELSSRVGDHIGRRSVPAQPSAVAPGFRRNALTALGHPGVPLWGALVAVLGAALLLPISISPNTPAVAFAVLQSVIFAGVFCAAVGLAAANRATVTLLAAIKSERRCLEESACAEENRIRTELTALTHGPIQGRLAACAMALNFHAAEHGAVSEERASYIAAAVLEHLDAASKDLASLGGSILAARS